MAESFSPLSRTAESEVVSGPRSVARRTVLTSAALAVPAIHLVAVSPAFAASGGRVNTLTAPSGSMPASGGVTLTATVVDSTGAPMSGQAVSFTGPSGATFSPSSTTTDSAGAASTTADLQDQWAKPGATTTVTATASGGSLSRSFTVLGANALGFGAFFGNTPMQTRFEFPSPVVQITGGGNWDTTGNTYFVALLQDGQVWTYGANAKGQLGDGTTTDRYAWGPVVGLSDVTQIALGAESVTALTSDGAVTKWGDDPYRATTVPTPLDGLTGVTQIACGRATVFALLSDGSVKAWGSGQSGAAGIGGGWPGTTPTQVTGLTAGVTQIAAGALSGYALMTDGTVRAWGWNGYGQLGDGSTTDRDSPVAVSTLTGTASQITATALGMFVLRSDGSVVGCGYNGDGGELGNGTTSPTANPALAPVSGLSSGTRTISGGGYTVYALMTDGSVRAWGSNSSGQRGDGTTTSSAVPQNVAVTIPNNRKIVAVAAPSVGSLTGFVIVDTP